MAEEERFSSAAEAGTAFPPPFIYFIALGVGYLLHRLWPLPIVNEGGERLALGGWALVGVWAVLTAWTMVHYLAAKNSLAPTRPTVTLVEAGPYRLSRHPMYLGLAILSLGICLLWNALWPVLLLPIAAVVLDRTVIVAEEIYLEQRFGDQYRRYKERVRRWL